MQTQYEEEQQEFNRIYSFDTYKSYLTNIHLSKRKTDLYNHINKHRQIIHKGNNISTNGKNNNEDHTNLRMIKKEINISLVEPLIKSNLKEEDKEKYYKLVKNNEINNLIFMSIINGKDNELEKCLSAMILYLCENEKNTKVMQRVIKFDDPLNIIELAQKGIIFRECYNVSVLGGFLINKIIKLNPISICDTNYEIIDQINSIFDKFLLKDLEL